jgi:glutathione S-transferase
MKLYYYPGASSMAVHIVLREAGYAFELDRVDLAAKTTASGEDYMQVNGKGYVPALRLDDGQVLTEDAVILQYLADHRPEAGLAPPTGTLERYRLMEWLNFVASELHPALGALFNPKMTPEWREAQIDRFGRRAGWLAGQLQGRSYLMGERYTVADAYLYTALGWCDWLKVDLGPWPVFRDYMARIGARPAVQEAMRAERLVK